MMKEILVALDYNPAAQKIAEAGFSLAQAMNAELILLHVSTNPSYYTSTLYDPIMGFGGYTNTYLLQPDFIVPTKNKIDFSA